VRQQRITRRNCWYIYDNATMGESACIAIESQSLLQTLLSQVPCRGYEIWAYTPIIIHIQHTRETSVEAVTLTAGWGENNLQTVFVYALHHSTKIPFRLCFHSFCSQRQTPAQRPTFCQEQEQDLVNVAFSTPVQPPGTLFHPTFMILLIPVHLENDSRMYFLIVLLTDLLALLDVSYSGALQILRWLIDWVSRPSLPTCDQFTFTDIHQNRMTLTS